MTIFQRLGLLAFLSFAAFMSGFFYGQNTSRKAVLEQAVSAFQQSEKIKNEVATMDDFELCIALGGLRDICTTFLRGLDKTPEGK